ncbi:galactose mutarotase-like protein [Trichodelitschia bisporula]|uniref:Galactose mutarotase-like protein n=1 Tax=Trichodelitschia bisporula TaxID=703511 RepID=A0A6G1IAV9_9PEZI|nr:galactose mutarotase-like protein [Trichodelitschia bisporula]
MPHLTLGLLALAASAVARLSTSESATHMHITSPRLVVAINKSYGVVDTLVLDGIDLLGPTTFTAPTPGESSTPGFTVNGTDPATAISGVGPYLDCHCIPDGSGAWTPGTGGAEYEAFAGSDARGTAFVGVRMQERWPYSGQVLSQTWVLRNGETGVHTWTGVEYPVDNLGPTRDVLQELRVLFRPSTRLWTHMLPAEGWVVPLPRPESVAGGKRVQDASFDLSGFPDDPYVRANGPYFSKYIFATPASAQSIYGLYTPGSPGAPTAPATTNSTASPNDAFAALLLRASSTSYGGPHRTDLTTDGILYDYLVSNHFGAHPPALTPGYSRVFGPAYWHFSHAPAGTVPDVFYAEARRAARAAREQGMYDAVAKRKLVPGYVAPGSTGTFRGRVKVPRHGGDVMLILSAPGLDVQRNADAPGAFQYWSPVGTDGSVRIKDVVPAKYRVTVQARGVWGEFVDDAVEVKAGNGTGVWTGEWVEEQAGEEVWRVGTPDGSAGEFRHGDVPVGHPAAAAAGPNLAGWNASAPTLGMAEYRNFWASYNFPTDFPFGVRFLIGKSTERRDWNYVHWASWPGASDEGGQVSVWSVLWDGKEGAADKMARRATLTIQLAGAKTANGNLHSDTGRKWGDVPLAVGVNGKEVGVWVIPHDTSSSCAIRSGISCYTIRHQIRFPAALLRPGRNELTLKLPAAAAANETADLPGQVYVQYDALRLEIG